jgi:hypothetical protein
MEPNEGVASRRNSPEWGCRMSTTDHAWGVSAMKGFLLLFIGLALAWTSCADARGVRVSGYMRKDGTYVAPHYRSAPNGSTLDNYSTRGNYNPYTGQAGKKNSYALPPRSGGYGSGDVPSVPASTYAQPVYRSPPVPTEPAAYRLAASSGSWPRFNAPATASPQDVNDVERYGSARANYLASSAGSLCNEFLLAADEMARSAETLAKCASRMDPRQTCAVEADDAMQSSIRYQVSASKAQSYCRTP